MSHKQTLKSATKLYEQTQNIEVVYVALRQTNRGSIRSRKMISTIATNPSIIRTERLDAIDTAFELKIRGKSRQKIANALAEQTTLASQYRSEIIDIVENIPMLDQLSYLERIVINSVMSVVGILIILFMIWWIDAEPQMGNGSVYVVIGTQIRVAWLGLLLGIFFAIGPMIELITIRSKYTQ